MTTIEEFVIIRPKVGSKKFQTMEGMRNFVNISKDGGENYADENVGIWEKERFPKSRQMFRPSWSDSKRKWLLRGFDQNSPELNELVAQCKLKYKVGHPMANQYIKEADIYDWNDPFFNHKGLKVLAQEGDTVISKTRPLERIILAGLLMNPRFQYNSDNSGTTVSSNRVKYVIIDKTIEGNARRRTREKSTLVHELWKGLNDQKKKALAISLNLIKSEDQDSQFVDDVLWDYAMSNSQAKGSHLSKQDMFIEMANLTAEKLNIQLTIGKARLSGFLKETRQGWLLFGNNIGRTKTDVEKYFANDENQLVIERLEKQLDEV